jgi:PAS domain S-box-containing protein
MINLFTYLSFSSITLGQLYQHLIIALLSIIILYSTFYSLKTLPQESTLRGRFSILFFGFISLILNIGLFFIFLYIAKNSFGISAAWFPFFSVIIHVVSILSHIAIASSLLVSKKGLLFTQRFLTLLYSVAFVMIILSTYLFSASFSSTSFYKHFIVNNSLILFSNLFLIFFTSLCFVLNKFKITSFLRFGIFNLGLAAVIHTITLLNPHSLQNFLVIYNLLIIFAFLFIEISIFSEIVLEATHAKDETLSLNNELEERINDRTKELYNSNKELFNTNYMLHQEKEKLNTMIENLDEGIIVSNINNKILLINGRAKNLLGIENSVIGGSLSEVLPIDHYLETINHIILKKIKKTSKEIKFTLPNKETLSLHLKSSLSTDSKGNIIGIITLLRNITKEVEIEQFKSGFLRAMSHELKTPLTTIIGFTETLAGKKRGPLNEDQEKYVNIVLQSGLNLHQLINDLLDFTRLNSNKISLNSEELSLKALLNSLLDSFRPQAQVKNIEIFFDEEYTIPSIQGDKEKLQKAFLNIINNAMDYTHEGKISIDFETDNGQVITKITDTGIGIKTDDQKRIFEKFIKLSPTDEKSSRPGLGLGLSVAKDLITLHDGKIWVESKEGKGSTFFIQLPIAS